MMMDAPIYAPSVRYVQPVAAPYAFGIGTVSIAELMAWPAAWAIVLKHAPMMTGIAGSGDFKPVSGNITLPDLKTFIGPALDPQLAQIDGELRQLPAAERPTL